MKNGDVYAVRQSDGSVATFIERKKTHRGVEQDYVSIEGQEPTAWGVVLAHTPDPDDWIGSLAMIKENKK